MAALLCSPLTSSWPWWSVRTPVTSFLVEKTLMWCHLFCLMWIQFQTVWWVCHFLEKQIWFLLTFVLYTFFPFMERIISYSIKNIVCILYPDRGGISYRQCGSSSWHWVVDRTQVVLLIQHLHSGQIIHLPSCELVAVTESKVDWHWMWIPHNRDLQLSVSET